jgi:hypothetical protein
MRKILILLTASLIQTAAAAEPPKEMYMPNDAGGFVVLTAEPCTHKSVAKEYPYRAYATEGSDAVMHEGCWSTPDTSEVPTELMVKEEGAGPAPTLRVIKMVNTWWVEGGKATFFQSSFLPEKKRYLSNGTIERTLQPIVVKPK